MAFEKKSFDRSRAIDHLPQDPQQRDQVGAARPPMDDGGEGRTIAARIELPHVRRRLRSHDREHALDRLQHAQHATERERPGDESDHLAVVVFRETADDLYRIGGRVGMVELGVQPIEHRFQVGNRSQVSSLKSQVSSFKAQGSTGD